jgi:hypothetical protein
MSTATGRCACGALTYTVDGPLRDVWNCHCYRCRRITGHHMAGTRADADAVTISGDTLRWYEPDASCGYGFCGDCGSSLFYRAADRPQYLVIGAGTLDQPTGLHTVAAWWMAEHGDYHTPASGLDEHERDG